MRKIILSLSTMFAFNATLLEAGVATAGLRFGRTPFVRNSGEFFLRRSVNMWTATKRSALVGVPFANVVYQEEILRNFEDNPLFVAACHYGAVTSNVVSAASFGAAGLFLSEETTVVEDFPELTLEQAQKIHLTKEEWKSYMDQILLVRSFSENVRQKDFKTDEEAFQWMEEQNFGGLTDLTVMAMVKIVASTVNWNF